MPDIDVIRAALAGRYDLVALLGEGGMATVWRARDLKHGRDVALKLLRPEVAGAVTAERFLREVQLTASLQHPNILPLFDSGEVEGLPWYAMPFIEGESLRARLARERQLAVPDAVRIARQVASALAYAHRRGVVHRDVKPENILLQDGHAYVADFGIALAVARADTGRLTETGLLVGTPHYMSPEQATGGTTLDGRSDQWALGAILYEMLAGEPPHSGATVQALVARIAAERPTALGVVRPGVPPVVEAVVTRALQKVPADRFATTDELEEALATSEAALRTPVPQTPVASAAAPPSAPVPRGGRWIPGRLAIVAAAAIAVALGVFAALRRRPAPGGVAARVPSVAIAVVPCEDRTADATLSYIADGLTENLVNRLTRVTGLRVIPRGVVRAAAPQADPMALARAVGASHLVTCSVSRAGADVRLGAQLVQAEPPQELWADGGSAPEGRLLAIEDSLLQRVVASLPVEVGAGDRATLAAGDTRDGEAQRLYLLGRQLWHRFSPAEMQAALGYFEQAIARDSAYARAYSGVASVYIATAFGLRTMPADAAIPRADAALARGLAVHPDDPDLLASHAMIQLWYERNLGAARADLDRAVATGRTTSSVHQTLQHWHAAAGQLDSAIAQVDSAILEDPTYGRLYTDKAGYLMLARRYDAADSTLAEAIAVDPRSATSLNLAAYLAALRGREGEARAALARLAAVTGPAWVPRTDRALVLALLGDRPAAAALLDTLEQAPPGRVEPAIMAAAWGTVGDRSKAFGWLARARREGSRWLLTMPEDPRFDALRDDPRFAGYVAAVRRGR